jgi:hypothetical protein
VSRLVALVAACALVGASAAPDALAKPQRGCGKAKVVKKKKRCAKVRRAAIPRAAAERLSAFDPASPAPGNPGTPPGPGTPPAPSPIRFVSVRALEYSLTLSRPLVNAGAVTIELRNNGEDPHNLIVSPDDGSHAPLATWADADPATVARKTVTLAAGRYQLWCSLLDHEARGMTVDLVVE